MLVLGTACISRSQISGVSRFVIESSEDRIALLRFYFYVSSKLCVEHGFNVCKKNLHYQIELKMFTYNRKQRNIKVGVLIY
jgi:hypothetical protein